jgi:exosome complex RNA-binding protein Rrp4
MSEPKLSEAQKSERETALETIKDYKKCRIRSFAIINGRIWCDKSNLLEHLVRDPKSVAVLEAHYARTRAARTLAAELETPK